MNHIRSWQSTESHSDNSGDFQDRTLYNGVGGFHGSRRGIREPKMSSQGVAITPGLKGAKGGSWVTDASDLLEQWRNGCSTAVVGSGR